MPGQYRGYRDEPGFPPDSTVETFAALRLEVDTWRWAGVPFLIRAGKKLPTTSAEVVVDFRKPPLDIFRESVTGSRNSVRFRLSPEIVIALQARAKTPGEAMRGEHDGAVAVRQYRPGTWAPGKQRDLRLVAGTTPLAEGPFDDHPRFDCSPARRRQHAAR